MPEQLANQATLLVALCLRPLTLFFAAPPFNTRSVPVAARVGLAGAIAFLMLPAYSQHHPNPNLSLATFVAEPLVGLVLAFSLRLAFDAVAVAGALLDMDAGLNLSQHLDPSTSTPVQIVGGLQTRLAMMLYLSLGGYHSLLRALAASYDQIALGGVHLSPELALEAAGLGAALFSDGLRIALPILAATLLTTVALAVAARVFPEANAFMLGQPLKLGVALIALVSLSPLYAAIYADLFQRNHTGALHLFELLSGG